MVRNKAQKERCTNDLQGNNKRNGDSARNIMGNDLGTQQLLIEDSVDTRLYPQGHGEDDYRAKRVYRFRTTPSENVTIPVTVTAIGVKTDWHDKRPTNINVYKSSRNNNGTEGSCTLLAQFNFRRHTKHVCGMDYQSPCTYPDVNESARAQLTVPVDTILQYGESLEIESYGNLGGPFAILQGSRVFGSVYNDGTDQRLIVASVEGRNCTLATAVNDSSSSVLRTALICAVSVFAVVLPLCVVVWLSRPPKNNGRPPRPASTKPTKTNPVDDCVVAAEVPSAPTMETLSKD